MDNVGFLRTRIEFITSFFAPGEVSELWITFPDPQLKTRRAKKRLTAPPFLACYAQLLAPGGWINLKTDSQHLYRYTGEVIRRCGLRCAVSNPDIYGTGYADKVLSIKTAYEQMFLDRGLPITYTRFTLDDTGALRLVRLGGGRQAQMRKGLRGGAQEVNAAEWAGELRARRLSVRRGAQGRLPAVLLKR